jgi:hypothetical protein
MAVVSATGIVPMSRRRRVGIVSIAGQRGLFHLALKLGGDLLARPKIVATASYLDPRDAVAAWTDEA